MTDVSGIPNMGFGGGSNFADPYSGLSNAFTSQAQTNNYLSNQQNQLAGWNAYDPWANTPGGFGAQTAYYQQQAANSYGNINNATLSPASVGYGGSADMDWMQQGSQGPRPSSGQAGIDADTQWYLGGSQGDRPSRSMGSGGIGSDAARAPNQPDVYSQGYGSGLSFGGLEDTMWMYGGSQGMRPSSITNQNKFGGTGDIQWMLGGSQGTRPSTAARDDLAQVIASSDKALAAQRQDYANRIRDDPNLSLNLAARLYSEDQNNAASRTAILEAMLNRLNATGQDPLNAAYYPKDQSQYNAALAKVSSDNDLLNRLHQEMEQAFGGSNISNYATDWASAGVADTAKQYATPTWTSPTSEYFFRKDINNDWTGAGIADKNRKWYESLTGMPR